MHPNPRKIAPIILILVLASLAYWYFGIYKSRAENGTLSASGTIEARLVRVSAELGGRVIEVLTEEGSPVKAGDTLVRFDTTLLAAQRTQAEATLNVAQANAEAAQANAKALQANADAARDNADAAKANTQAAKANITAAQALLTAAQAGQAAAQAGLDAAQANYDLLKIGPSAEQVHLAQTVIDKARIAADAAQEAYDALPEGLRDTTNGKTLKQQLDAANATVANAQAQYDLTKAGAQPGQLTASQALVDGAQAQLDNAAAQVDSTQAKVDAAQSQADAAQALAEAAGSQAEALQSQAEAAAAQAEAANAQVEAARAALNILEVQINKMTLSAPADGRVLSRSIQPGEIAAAGAPLLMLGQLDDLTITVYIPEDRYGAISLGETAQVSVDSFSGETFTAKVTYIADKAEFTPRNVQTAEGRRSTVFAVKLSIENPEGKLKPGMPADVRFGKWTMNKSLLVGIWKYLLPVPRSVWQGQVAKSARHASEGGLAFMSEDHHRVRDFVVMELPRFARPLSAALIAERVNLPLDRVTGILTDLEKHMTFLYRNPQGEVTWAYPVTVDHTPHRVTFSSGEQIYAAWAIDAIATPFVQGQLRKERLSFKIETECTHCHTPLYIEMDSDLNYQVVEKGAKPVIFSPMVDFGRLKDPSIIDAFWRKSVFFWSEEHAKEYRRQVQGVRGSYMTLPQAVYITPLEQGALFACEKRR